MIHHVKYLFLLESCLIIPLSMTYAYNSASYDSGIDRLEAIQPLPTLKVEQMGKEITSRYVAPEVIFDAMPAAPAVGMRFSLNELNEEITNIEKSYVAAAMVEDPTDADFIAFMRKLGQGNYSAKAKKIQKKVNGLLNSPELKLIDQLTGGDLVTMPLVKNQMIGETEVNIIFNKARIYPQYTVLEVYIKVKMAQVDIEGNPVELFFAADDILFSQEEGIIGGTIGLVNDYAIRIGNSENAAVWLKGMTKTIKDDITEGVSPDPEDPFDDKYYDKGGTYVSFDCDGFKEMGIAGEVLFSRAWVIPADENGLPIQSTSSEPPRVKAVFGAVVQNMDDLFISIDMPHFLVSKYQDISLNIGGAFLDLSSYRNPPGVPAEYGIEPDLWEGVYIQNLGITLPEPFKRTCGSFTEPPENPDAKPETCRIKITAEHLLIDEYGLDGTFSVSGQAPLIGGPIMDGEWGWSMNTLSLQIENSELTAFGFAGGIGVPILDKDDPLMYTADINLSNKKEFVFTVNTSDNTKKSFPVWNAATVNLVGPIGVDIFVIDGEFDASITLSGNLTIGNPKDKKEGEGGSILTMPSITFEDLTFSTKSPKFTIGSFGLTNEGDQASIVNFPVVPTGLTLSTPNNSDEVNLDFGVIINLMNVEESKVTASGSFTLKGEIERDLGGARRWVYKDLLFTGAEAIVDVPQFYGKGFLKVFRNDEIYGSGFSANMTVKVLGSDLNEPGNTGMFSLKMAAIFGSSPSSTGDLGQADPDGEEEVALDNYRYWMMDGLIQSDAIKVPIMHPFELNGFGGGAFYHMRPFSYNEESGASSDAIAQTQIGEATTGIVYAPNANTGLGIKFTTSVTSQGDLMSGLLTCIVRFSPGGSLQNVTFWGTVDILKDGGVNNRAKPDIKERVGNNLKSTEEIIAQDVEDAKNLKETKYVSGDESVSEPGKGIKGQIGISFDFEGGFSFHGFAKVTIQANDLKGVGTLDLLLDLSDDDSASDKGDWHLYIGGYYQGNSQQVLVPGFFNEDEEVLLEPVSVVVDYGGAQVSAQAYFLTGTKIPPPPSAPAEVVSFFSEDDPDVNNDNRDKLICGGKGPALGTGIAFGATAGFNFDIKKGGVFGRCPFGIEVRAYARVGFDLALLKYASNTTCSISGDSPQGLKGFRATGRAYALVDLRGGHITCFKLPNVGIGVKVEFDVLRPSYLDVKLTVKAFGEKATIGFDIGDQCGIICQ